MTAGDNKTPLYDWHVAQQAKMENFGGFLMPMWYGSAKSEHLAVLTHAGLFDTSHMDTLTVRGHQARDLLQHCFTKDPVSIPVRSPRGKPVCWMIRAGTSAPS